MSSLTNFDLNTRKSQKIFNLMPLHWSKVYIAWAKKVHRSYRSWHWKVMRNFKKSYPVVWNMKLEFGKLSPEHLKVSKLGLWWEPFVQSRKCINWKFTEELCVMTMKKNAKFEEKLTFYFKTDMKNLTNFVSSTWKSKKIALWLSPLTKVYNVYAKKSRE